MSFFDEDVDEEFWVSADDLPTIVPIDVQERNLDPVTEDYF